MSESVGDPHLDEDVSEESSLIESENEDFNKASGDGLNLDENVEQCEQNNENVENACECL